MQPALFTSKARVVIIGAGFAGLNAAKPLLKKGIEIVVIDRANHHLFQPLLYQVATAGLSPADIAAPIRQVLHGRKNIEVILGDVVKIDCSLKQIHLASGEAMSFDFLVLATGASHNYFGHDEWETFAPGLKTLEDAVEIRARVLLAFEMAEREKNLEKRRALLTFAVIGAGPTGVEMAGAIAELARFTLAKDFHNINLDQTRVVLIEASDRILQAFPEKLSWKAHQQLRRMGVEVMLKQRVTNITPDKVWFGEEFLNARTAMWAAGVQASFLGAQLGVAVDRAGRVPVNPDLRIDGHPEIFVIGDLASVPDKKRGQVPAMAAGAIQEGVHTARNIMRIMRGEKTKPFRYFDKGSLATVGRRFAVAETGPFKFSGVFARLIWIFIHILYLVSYRSKLFVMLHWAWSYFTYQKGARLITPPIHPTGVRQSILKK